MTDSVTDEILCWYEANSRALPWRLPPAMPLPDDPAWPYRVWLSEVMLQQTTVGAAKRYFEHFTTRWPTVTALAAASDAEVMAAWAGLGYYARARNLLACARAVVEWHGGRFPDREAALRRLPGIGSYTAAAIAAIAFDRDTAPVDANVERVVARLFAIGEPLPSGRRAIGTAAAQLYPTGRCGDFAQALMDLGSGVCKPRSPDCPACPVRAACLAYATGEPAAYPVKAARRARPIRHGVAWWIERDGAVLLVRRPAKGLLGGMASLPSSDWATDDDPPAPPIDTDWRHCGTVTHGFTHFELRLRVVATVIPREAVTHLLQLQETVPGFRQDNEGLCWWVRVDNAAHGLPTLFAHAARLALATRTGLAAAA